MPTCEFLQKLSAARLASDVMDVPTLIIARTDAFGAYLLTSDIDDRDKALCTGGLARGACSVGWSRTGCLAPGSLIASS